MKNAGGGALLDMKDKNGFTAADHASRGKTQRLGGKREINGRERA